MIVDVWVGDIVDLGIVDVLVDRPAVVSTTRRTLKLALEFCPRLDQPTVSQRHEEHGIDLGIDHIVAAGNETECAGTASENGDRFFGVWILALSSDQGWRQEQEEAIRSTTGQFPARGRTRFFCKNTTQRTPVNS